MRKAVTSILISSWLISACQLSEEMTSINVDDELACNLICSIPKNATGIYTYVPGMQSNAEYITFYAPEQDTARFIKENSAELTPVPASKTRREFPTMKDPHWPTSYAEMDSIQAYHGKGASYFYVFLKREAKRTHVWAISQSGG